MIPFNLYGVMILFPCGGVVFFVFSRLDVWIKTTGPSEGFWIGVFFLTVLTFSSICASVFDRTNIRGVVTSYRALWRQFYYGERTHPKSRVAGVFTPLVMSPCLVILITSISWMIEAFCTPPREPITTYLALIGLSVVSCAFCLGVAKLTEGIRLIKDKGTAEPTVAGYSSSARK